MNGLRLSGSANALSVTNAVKSSDHNPTYGGLLTESTGRRSESPTRAFQKGPEFTPTSENELVQHSAEGHGDLAPRFVFTFRVFNLPLFASVLDLVELFRPYGSISAVRINTLLLQCQVVCSGSGSIELHLSLYEREVVLSEIHGVVYYPGHPPLMVIRSITSYGN